MKNETIFNVLILIITLTYIFYHEENKTIIKNIKKEKEKTDFEKRKEIIKNFQHTWKGYEKYAFGSDELKPVTNKVKYIIQ
jgi:lipopolysaccharide export system protein LptC